MILVVLFWIWGILGLIINGITFLTLPGDVGVGTSAYLAAGNLMWIGGMVLFGFGAVIGEIRPKKDDVPGDIKIEGRR